MLEEAIDYPRRGDGWLARIGIGGILYLLSFLIIPLFLIEGYLYRVLAGTVRGDEQPPDWGDWLGLFVDGVKMFVVQIVYALVPVVLIVAGAMLTATGAMTADALEIVGWLVVALGFIVSILVAYLIPAALANFARTGQLGAAFDVTTVRNAAFTGSYFWAIVLALILAIILGMIGSILMIILVGIFVLFYAQVVVYYLWARGFTAGAEGTGEELAPS